MKSSNEDDYPKKNFQADDRKQEIQTVGKEHHLNSQAPETT